MFGLSFEQTRIMFSMQKKMVCFDSYSKIGKETHTSAEKWIQAWEKGILTYLKGIQSGLENYNLISSDDELNTACIEECRKSPNKTWYYIMVLECMAFVPYFSLGDKENDKLYKKCNYNQKRSQEFVGNYFAKQGIINHDMINRLLRTYNKSINKIYGKGTKIAVRVITVIAIGGIGMALAAVFAGPIAVTLFGSQFSGLSGAALTSACLATAGGGAIAAGGTGMAGGIVAIAGGGALLGTTGGAVAVGGVSLILTSGPKFTLTQAAKLETILKEVILNAQKDVVTAQKLIRAYQQRCDELSKQLTEMELKNEKNKKEIKEIKTSLKYIKKSCKDMNIFASAYQEGLKAEE